MIVRKAFIYSYNMHISLLLSPQEQQNRNNINNQAII
jgi:hypothetical protein